MEVKCIRLMSYLNLLSNLKVYCKKGLSFKVFSKLLHSRSYKNAHTLISELYHKDKDKALTILIAYRYTRYFTLVLCTGVNTYRIPYKASVKSIMEILNY